MRKLRTFLKYTVVLCTLVLIWLVFFITKLVLEDASNENLNFIPMNATLVVQIDGDRIIKEGLSCAVLHKEDPELIKLLDALLKQKRLDPSKQFGIRYDSDIVLFSVVYRDKKYIGSLFNLNKPREFTKNLGAALSYNQGLAAQNNVGLVLTLEGILFDENHTNEISAICKRLLAKETDFFSKKNRKDSNSKSSLKIWVCSNDFNNLIPINEGLLEFSINEQTVDISGRTDSRFLKKGNESLMSLHPSDFHFSTKLFSGGFNDSIKEIFGANFPSISGLSVNYHGMDMIGDPSFFLVPNVDFIVQFEENVNFLKILTESKNVKVISENEIEYGTIRFNFQKIDDRSYYIGKTLFDSVNTTQYEEITILKGDLKSLVKINGGGMVRKFLEMTNMYITGKTLSDRIERVDLKMEKPINGISQIHGSVTFKSKYQAINEILKIGLSHQIIQ